MSEDKPKGDAKKDLTGIFELASETPPPAEETIDPFAVNEMPNLEKIDDFASIESLGLLDHPGEEANPPGNSDFLDLSPQEEALDSLTEDLLSEPEVQNQDPDPELGNFSEAGISADDFQSAESFQSPESFADVSNAVPSMDYLDEIKTYSERTKESAFTPKISTDFHLSIQGTFDPFSRDKLLLFINESPIGINSSELDLQLSSGRVFFPRISEFTGIKLIQELRDSGLAFKLTPSPRDADEPIPPAPSLNIHYETPVSKEDSISIPVLPDAGFDQEVWEIIDSIQMVQYLNAEILEVEKSELFQTLIDRMLEAMKRKARRKGAQALSGLTHELTPLRLPSQYQVEMKANLVKRR